MVRRIVPVVVLAGVAVAVILVLRGRDDGTDVRILLSGNVEVTGIELSFKLAGRIAERPVAEGELVAVGALVARLDRQSLEAEVALREAALRQAEAAREEVQSPRPEEVEAAAAGVARAEAVLRDLQAGAREPEIRAAEAAAEAAAAEVERLGTELARTASLLEQRVVSKDDYDRVQSAHDVAAAKRREAGERLLLLKAGSRPEQIAQAEGAVRQVRAEHELIRQGPRRERRDQAEAAVEQARAAVDIARIRLADATLTSPADGLVLVEHAEAGEFVAAGAPVVTVADLRRVWVRAFLDETDLGRVKTGMVARVTTDTWPDREFRGTVSFISSEAEFTPKTVSTKKERVKLTYRIKVDLKNPDCVLLPGMPVDLEILEGE